MPYQLQIIEKPTFLHAVAPMRQAEFEALSTREAPLGEYAKVTP